jgi:hypothetical protein
MKRIIIIKLLLVVASFCFSQMNGNFTNLDVRNRSTFRGPHYIYDSTYFKPYSVNVPLLATGQPLGWFLTTTKGAEAKLVRVTIGNLADSLGPFMPQYWSLSGDDIENNNAGKVILPGDSTFFDAIPGEATKVGRILHVNQYGEIEWTSPATLKDTLEVLMPQYWTYVDAATDTLYNNSPPEDSLGVVLFKHPIELLPTTATTGMIKQGGSTIFHTYHEKGDNNLFIGQGAGNLTADSSFNIGIGKGALSKITDGYKNTAIGYNALGKNTSGGVNVAVGDGALSEITTTKYNTAVGSNAMRNTGEHNTAIGYRAMFKDGTTALRNTAVGSQALLNLTTGDDNIAIGLGALMGISDGSRNIGIGWTSNGNNYSGDDNIAIGYKAIYGDVNKTRERNIAIGNNALSDIAVATNNVCIGHNAGVSDSIGSDNVFIGYESSYLNKIGNKNIFLGYQSGYSEMGSNKLYIENSNSATPLIYGDFAADSIVINGDVTVTGNILYTDTHWDDLTTAAEAAKLGVNNKPVFNYDSLALKWDDADSTTNYIVANFQMKHTYAPGTDIYPHIHYIQSSTADTVEWFIMDYKWVDVGEARPGAFTRIHTNDQTVFPYTSGSIHQIAEFPAIDGTGHTESSILECRIYCWADGEIYTKELDIHFQINKPGTYNEYP